MIFSKSPFFRFTLFFILGIVAYHFLGDAVLIKWGILLLAFIAYVFLSIKNTLRHQLLLSSLAFFMLFGLGTWRLASFRDEQKENHLLHVSEGTVAYKAVITSEPAEKQNSIQCKLDVYAIWNGKTWRPVSGLVNGYVSLKKGTTLQYGDLLYVSGSPELTAPPANPGAFNYQQYLSYSRIHHQQFIRDDFEIIGHDTPSWFLDKAFGLRKHSVQQISKYITDEYARGVTLALVLGVKDELEDDLVKAFSATGAMHVLAVSGLHVGIVYAFVFLLLKRLGLSRRKYRWVLALVSVMVLWCYAFLTGLSPSVLRAVTMFTFVAFGKALSRHSNIYNTLAASAMALLLYNPYLLMSVGFQLSYIAVFGIVYLQPKLYSLLVFEHKLLDKVWTITCVSV